MLTQSQATNPLMKRLFAQTQNIKAMHAIMEMDPIRTQIHAKKKNDVNHAQVKG